MRPNILLSVLILVPLLSWGQRPEKVVRITRETHSTQWYHQQAEAWRSFLQKNPQDAAGWQSYYEANRALRNLAGKPLQDLDQIVGEMKATVPASFEYHYLVYRQGGISNQQNLDRFQALEKAHMIDPGRTEVLEEFVTHYELIWEPAKRREYNIKRYHSNDIPYELLAYNYNVLMSLQPHAILITNGDNDTYPLWLLQDALGLRQDVIVLNRSLAYENTYLNRLLGHYNIPAFTQKIESQADFDRYHTELRQHLLRQTSRPFYYALTVNPSTYEGVRDKLYVVGLASLYSESRIDNLGILAQNFEDRFALDYLRTALLYHESDSPAGRFEQAYLMPLLSLHRYYQEQHEQAKATDCRQLILQIARKAGREAEVQNALQKD